MSQQTARTMHPFVGMIGDLHSSADYPLTFRVEVLDVRPRFGGTDYHVRPVAGSGVRWVNADRVTDLAAPTAVAVTLPVEVAREVAQSVTYRFDYLTLSADSTDEERTEADRLGEALGVLAAAGVSIDLPSTH